MAKLTITTITCIFLGASTCFSLPSSNLGDNFDAVVRVGSSKVDNFVVQNDKIELLKLRKESTKEVTPFQSISYTLGNRVTGDYLLASGENGADYPILQDVEIELSYPQSGIGGIVTFVQILVEQSSDNGNAYVVAGGIGQRFMRLIVQAKETSFIKYKAYFYGY